MYQTEFIFTVIQRVLAYTLVTCCRAEPDNEVVHTIQKLFVGKIRGPIIGYSSGL